MSGTTNLVRTTICLMEMMSTRQHLTALPRDLQLKAMFTEELHHLLLLLVGLYQMQAPNCLRLTGAPPDSLRLQYPTTLAPPPMQHPRCLLSMRQHLAALPGLRRLHLTTHPPSGPHSPSAQQALGMRLLVTLHCMSTLRLLCCRPLMLC